MSRLTFKLFKTLLLGTIGLGIASQQAVAVEMEVTASVQNTLTAVVDNELTFGTIFTTSALATSAGQAVRSPSISGVTNLVNTALFPETGITFISLGGSERGEVTVTVPPNNTTNFNVTLTGLTPTAPGQGGTACAAALTNFLPLTHTLGNPATPDFNVSSWVLDFGPGATAVGTFSATAGAPVATVTPAFAGDTATFYLGATIRTECVAGDFEEGDYTGTLTIDVGY